MTEPLLALDAIDVRYGPTQVLWGVTLRVEPGEVVAVMGPNGSGKSTVLKAAMGLKGVSGGRVMFRGEDMTRRPATARPGAGMSIVLERRRLFPFMSVRENIELGAYARRLSRADLARSFDEVLALFPEIAGHLDATAARLSGGQQQMVAIARGLMGDPQLLLMDEPLLGLSPALQRHVIDLMGRINQRGVAILFNEQNAKLSFGLSHRGYLLESGRVVLEGSGVEMLDHPEVRRVYLGEEAA
ncbi:ABC transporter ATP-binding protein [Paracoccus sp. S-4012]|uniref:ABC transporter ATP-binding protein n=1 Tax=Paracoccus sp. S-4012 TaxID=2665648 RepID=UPI0018A22C02|nr:ABC transporter ATP-binding protein [Paracoccus sp. S-4012]